MFFYSSFRIYCVLGTLPGPCKYHWTRFCPSGVYILVGEQNKNDRHEKIMFEGNEFYKKKKEQIKRRKKKVKKEEEERGKKKVVFLKNISVFRCLCKVFLVNCICENFFSFLYISVKIPI